MCFSFRRIGDIYMLKDEIYNKYKILLDNYYKEIEEKKFKKKRKIKEKEILMKFMKKFKKMIKKEKKEKINIISIYLYLNIFNYIK